MYLLYFSFTLQSCLNDFYSKMILQCVYLYLNLGSCEEPKLSPDGLEHRKPKQIKLPSQAYIDLPLGKDAQRENPSEAESWEEAASANAATVSTEVTPMNNLSRSPQRKKTELALYGCTVLLASVALGLDLRELHKAQAAEEPLPKEEKKKREGIFQRASKSRRSASPPTRLPPTGREASSPLSLPRTSALGILSTPSLSTKCLLQIDSEDPLGGGTPVTCDSEMLTPDFSPTAPGSSREPALMPRLDTTRSVSGNLPTSFLEQTCGNVPYWASSKDRPSHHRRTMSDGNPTPSRLHELGKSIKHCCRDEYVKQHGFMIFIFSWG